ncbi:MAG: class I SAM-dependent methyltransferase [Gammaproteobacteria bacterium]|nr:class I SAM-dependent methyltransferase [Gammaproteobacteria bacterium]
MTHTTLNQSNIALFTEQSSLQVLVQEKSCLYNIPLLSALGHAEYLLIYESHEHAPGYICKLQKTGKPSPGPVTIDFTRGKAAHRRLFGGGRNQPLARAAGIKPGFNPVILDTTAGLGRDSFVFATLGCHVTMLERNPVIYELLQNGLHRALNDPDISGLITNNMRLHNENAINYLQQLASQTPDTIYLDPMYPARNKSALVKKEMRYFHDIAGKDGRCCAGIGKRDKLQTKTCGC